MDYQALPQVTGIKILWTIFPLVVISLACIVNPMLSFFFSDPVISAMLIIFPWPRLIRIMWDHHLKLHIDDEVIRLTSFRGVREIYWTEATVVQVKEKIRWYAGARVLLVQTGKATILYYISDLDPKDQRAIECRLARQPGYRHISL